MTFPEQPYQGGTPQGQPYPNYGAQPPYQGQQPFQAQPTYQGQPPYQGQPTYPGQSMYQVPEYQTPQPQQGYSPYPYATGYPQVVAPPNRKAMPWIIVGIVVLAVAAAIGIGLVVLAKNKSGGTTPRANSTGPGASTPPSTPPTTPGTSPSPRGTGGNPPANNGTQNMAMGTPITVSDGDGNAFTVTVNKVTYRTTGCGSNDFGLSDPADGDAYILIDVTYVTTKGVGHYNIFDWTVEDTAGKTYDDLGLFADCQPSLDSSNNLHGTRHGVAVIEVKKAVQHGRVVYTPGLLADTSSTWKF
ncbi:MAG TPA: hypothetical protein VKB69_06300 [Micromonosporaceae bacterium]|nr:hypothetical protein [Micromonosporaceae bacterium]